MPKHTIYVAGPMTGYPSFNFPAFFQAQQFLQDMQFWVINPAAHDLETGGVEYHGETETYVTTDKFDLSACLAWDLEQVARVEALYMLDGWEKSNGARAEFYLASALGKEILYQTVPPTVTFEPKSPEYVDEKVLDGNAVLTTSETGGQKGSKEQRFDLIPVEALTMLATLYGRGAVKYDDENWRRGYDWKYSYAALQRHMNGFWGGEDIDPEMQLPHVIMGAWHCFTLATFMSDPQYEAFDNRPSTLARRRADG